jgi:putative ABC transport system permease protein
VAVLLVMLGTYCLFTAGSIVLLKLLRKNKRFYYRTGPFTAVSGLLYRMKQNAVGLANICILSTMVLVTVSTTVCLYTGVGDIVNSQHPYEIEIDLKGNGSISAEEQAEADQIVDETLAQNGLTAGRESYFALQFGAAEMDGGYRLMSNSFGNSITVDLGFLTAEDYNALTGENITLQKDEVLCYATPAKTADTLTIGEMTFAIRENLDSYPATNWWVMNNVIEGVGLVVADQEVMEQLWQLQYDVYGEKYCSDLQYIIGLEFDGTADQKLGCYYGMLQALRSSGLTFNASSRQSSADDTYLLYGSFLFLGIFLGAVFLMAAVLIIYYKQVSEGYEDRERFVILQKVGMDAATVKKSIRSQVLLVFFLPLLTAGIHIAFAFRLITRMLQLFYLQNVGLFATCTIVTLLLFAAVYVLIYALTARTYYKIVAGSRG